MLVAEDSIPINGIHIDEVPTPQSFFFTGGERGIDIALAYDPRTRARRLDYMSSRMDFHLVRGMQLDNVVEVFARLEEDDELDEDERGAPGGPGSDSPTIPTPSGLGYRLCKLKPSASIRSRGANQVGRAIFPQRLDPDRHAPLYLVLRNVNWWDDPTSTQPYAIALAMWRTESQQGLYAELEARLQAVIELPVEIELST